MSLICMLSFVNLYRNYNSILSILIDHALLVCSEILNFVHLAIFFLKKKNNPSLMKGKMTAIDFF